MKFKLEIRTDNAVYEESLYDELISNLRVVINQIDSLAKQGIIKDTNGNRVGKFYMTEED
jgi:ribosomal protein S20